jgi:predicted CXXCH cytochrome family protein
MKLEASMAKVLKRGGLVVIGLAGVMFALAAQAEAIGGFVVESSKAADLDQCVEPTEYMRRNHMELIRHQRDTTVYGGIRSTKHSLEGCVTCHSGHRADQTPVPIDSDGQFCAACHDYAAVTLNCFDCHATVPVGESWNQAPAGHSQSRLDGASEPLFALVAPADYVSAEGAVAQGGAVSAATAERGEGEIK